MFSENQLRQCSIAEVDFLSEGAGAKRDPVQLFVLT
jgi:hypothetical protein